MIKKLFILILILFFNPLITIAETQSNVAENAVENADKTTKVIPKANEKQPPPPPPPDGTIPPEQQAQAKSFSIKEEIEQAKKALDAEAESLDKLYEQAKETQQTNKQIFDEDNMEVEGKTFWTRKPIHPYAKYGYKGKLPNIVLEFEYKKTKDEYKCLIPSEPLKNKQELIQAPRDNKAYVDIVIKKGASSQYVNDVNDVIFILQKLIANIEDDVNVQKFNAQVSNLLDNIFYIQDKYKNKPESYYISYREMIQLAQIARDVAVYRTEAKAYAKYLAYSGEGAAYRPEKVKARMDNFLKQINKTLTTLKEVN